MIFNKSQSDAIVKAMATLQTVGANLDHLSFGCCEVKTLGGRWIVIKDGFAREEYDGLNRFAQAYEAVQS